MLFNQIISIGSLKSVLKTRLKKEIIYDSTQYMYIDAGGGSAVRLGFGTKESSLQTENASVLS